MKIRLGGVWRDILGCKIFQAGSWRTIIAVKIYSGGQWRSVGTFSPTGSSGGMTLVVGSGFDNPFTVTGSGAVLTASSKVVPLNGSKPYTYAWTILSQSGPGSVSIDSPTLAQTGITATFSSTGTLTVSLQCVATDRAGSTASLTVNGTFIRTA